MDDISDNDFKEFVKTVQDLALRAYPNPDRADCPNPQIIHDVAGQSRPSAHPVFQSHIVHCSPCIGDVLAERTRIQSKQKNRRRMVLAIAAGVCVLALMISVLYLRNRASAPGGNEIARAGAVPEIPIDLSPYSPTRSGAAQNPRPPVTVPNERLRLRLTLALGAPEGPYDIRILTDQLQAVRNQQATAVVKDGITSIPVEVDLGRLLPGRYTLALRPNRNGEEWQTVPMVLRPLQ
jgi:hypothetical protein